MIFKKKILSLFLFSCIAIASVQGLLNEPYQQIEDYHVLAKVINWSDFFNLLKESNGESLRLLDIGCGTGRWLTRFQSECYLQVELRCDLMDPSRVALEEAAKTLYSPLVAENLVQDIVQNTELPHSHYDIIWAMHSFYSIPENDLALILKNCMHGLKDGGHLFIAQSSNRGFYIQFYNLFQKHYSFDQTATYMSAELIIDAFQSLDLDPEIKIVEYVERIPVDDLQRLSHFILNECVGYSFNRDNSFANELNISDILNHPEVDAFLKNFIVDDHYEFSQELHLIKLSKQPLVQFKVS